MTLVYCDLFVLWVCGLLTCCSFLHLWFTTTLGAELALLAFPADVTRDLPEATRRDFDTWLNVMCGLGKLSRRLVHILQCPGCLSVHVSFWVGVFCGFVGWAYGVLDSWNIPAFTLTCVGTWPWLVHRLRRERV
jgi:hypothetical protein